MSFDEDSLLQKDGKFVHNDEGLSDDEEMTPTLDNLVVLIWLRISWRRASVSPTTV